MSVNENDRAIMVLLQKCSENYKNPAILQMPFTCKDRGVDERKYTMCYDKRLPHLKQFAGPDYSFHSWPSVSIHAFADSVRDIKVEAEKVPVIDKIGWFGNINSALPDVPENQTRPFLHFIGKQHPELFDVVHVYPRPGGIIDGQVPTYKSLPELVKYKYLIDIGGNGWSARLKFLLFSKRPLIIVDRYYVDYWYEDLVPYVHYIPVNMNLSNLLEQVQWMMDNHDKCIQIAEAAYDYATKNFSEEKILARVHEVFQNLQK
jgi:hypothetical protein